MPPRTPSAPLEQHLIDFLLRRLASPRHSEGARARSRDRMRAELYRLGTTDDERRAIDRGGRAGVTLALGLRIERALVAGALELDALGEWCPTEVRVDAEADESSTRGTAGARDLLVLTRSAGRDRERAGGSAEGERGVTSLRTLARTYDEVVAAERERGWAYRTAAAQLGSGATLIAVEERGDTLAAELGQVRLLALGDDFDPALAPVSAAMLGSTAATAAAATLGRSAPTAVGVGDTLDGKYELVEKLGQGGFGAVYRALDRDLDTEVAVKLLRAELAGQESAIEEFRAEARRVAKLEHPSIVGWKGFNAGSDAGPYFVMEFLRGTELVNVLREESPLPLERAGRILNQVLQALVAAHYPGSGERVLHLDLKPQNIFLTRAADGAESAKVIDFGIGKLSGRGGERGGEAGARLEEHRQLSVPAATLSVATRPGAASASIACTPEYASPEQARNMLERAEVVPLDDRSDLYSFGVVAFELLTGELPFERPPGGSRLELLQQHLETPPRRVRDLRGDVDRRLADFVDRCLAKRPEDRFESSRAALAEFEKILFARRHWTLIAVAAVAAAALLGLAWVVFLGGSSAPPRLEVALRRGGERLALERDLWVDAGAPAGVELILPPGSAPRLVEADDVERSLAGWSLEPAAGAGHFRLRAPAVEGRVVQRGRLVAEVDGERRLGDPFRLVALGPSAVVLSEVRIGGQRVEPGAELRVAPSGLSLAVELAADPGDVLQVEVGSDTDGVGWTRLGEPTDLGDGRVRWTTALENLGLTGGRQHRELRVVDRARTARTGLAALDLLVVPARPGPPSVDQDRLPRSGGRIVLTPDQVLELWVSADPDTEVVLEVERPGSVGPPVPRLIRTVDAAGAFTWPLPDALLHDADQRPLVAHEGVLRLFARHGDEVLLANRRDAVSRDVRLPYRYEPEPPALDPPRVVGATPLDDGRFAVVGSEAELVLTPSSASAVRAVVTLVGAPGFPRELELNGRPATVRLPLDRPGPHRVEIEVGRPGAASADRERTTTLELLRVPAALAPTLLLDGRPADGSPLRIGPGQSLPVLAATLAQEPWVELGARAVLRDVTTGGRWTWAGRLGPERSSAALAPPAGFEPASLPDGRHRLELELDDPLARPAPAAADAPVRAVELELARRPPDAASVYPAPGDREWGSLENGVFRAAVRIVDPNGVDLDGARLWLRAADAPQEVRTSGALTLLRDGEYEARFRLDHRWSGRAIDLLLDVADAYGNRVQGLELLVGCRLDTIENRLPTTIELDPPTPGGPVPTPMVLVRRPDDRSRFEFGKPLPREVDTVEVQVDAADFEPFYLDRHEVTVEQFRAFLQDPRGYFEAAHWPAQAPRAPGERRVAVDPGLDPERARARRDLLLASTADRAPRAPMTDVQWAEAHAYAHYVGKRLQSELEWQWAVRGAGDRSWSGAGGEVPWEDVAAQLAAGSLPTVDALLDVSAEGVAGLCSGVDEWTATPAWFDGDGARDRGSRRALVAEPEHRAAFLAPWPHTLDDARIVAIGHRAVVTEPPSYNQTRIVSSRSTRRASDVGFRCSLPVSRYEALSAAEAARPHPRASAGPEGPRRR